MKRALLLVLVLASLPARALPILAEPHLEREARVTWRAEDVRFGGFSGLEIAADGPPDLRILLPAFMISELRRGFEIGFLIALPFLIMIGIVIFEPLGMYGIWIRVKKYWMTWPF